jgi:hypothetical protein
MPRGFEVHTMREHNFANYMFFLKHLLNKPDTEYTGQVLLCLKNKFGQSYIFNNRKIL